MRFLVLVLGVVFVSSFRPISRGRYAMLSADGRYRFFSAPGRGEGQDIYWVDAEIVDMFRGEAQ
jgi:hypothetical protein